MAEREIVSVESGQQMKLTRTCSIVFVVVTLAGCHKTDSATPNVASESSYDLVRDWAVGESAVQPSSEPTSIASVSDMIGGLEERLEKEPNDVSGWSLLAQSYAYTGQMAEAAAAVDQAVQLGADRDELEQRVRVAHSGAR